MATQLSLFSDAQLAAMTVDSPEPPTPSAPAIPFPVQDVQLELGLWAEPELARAA